VIAFRRSSARDPRGNQPIATAQSDVKCGASLPNGRQQLAHHLGRLALSGSPADSQRRPFHRTLVKPRWVCIPTYGPDAPSEPQEGRATER